MNSTSRKIQKALLTGLGTTGMSFKVRSFLSGVCFVLLDARCRGGKLIGHIGKGKGRPEPAPSPFVNSCTILRHLTRSQRSTNFTGTGTATISVTAQHWRVHRHTLIFIGVRCLSASTRILILGL